MGKITAIVKAAKRAVSSAFNLDPAKTRSTYNRTVNYLDNLSSLTGKLASPARAITLSLGCLGIIVIFIPIIFFLLIILPVSSLPLQKALSRISPLPTTSPSPTTSPIPAGLSGCWPTTGFITQLWGSNHATYNIPSWGGQGSAIDIGANLGTPIVAPFSGIVNLYSVGTGPLTDSAGYYAIIHTDSGPIIGLYHFLPFSLRPPPVQSGSHVSAGEVIAYTGSTGHSTGPHVHYESWGQPIQTLVPNPQIRLNNPVSSSTCTSL